MKCPVCKTENKSIICNRCGFKSINKPKRLIPFFNKDKKLPKTTFAEAIEEFYKTKLTLKEYPKYYSKKEIKTTFYKYYKTSSFLKELKQSSALDIYLKQNKIHIDNALNLINFMDNIDDYFKKYNKEFQKKIYLNNKDYFNHILDDINKDIKLDDEQINCVTNDEDYCLILAGAGAGKSTTLCAKVKYLVDFKKVSPEDILVISFTNQAVKELKDKINKKLKLNTPVSTFHSIGRAITKKIDDSPKKIIPYPYEIVRKYLNEYILNDETMLNNLIHLFGYYFDISSMDLNNVNIDLLKEHLQNKTYYTLKQSNPSNTKQQIKTYKSEIVRSKEELQIANFLYLNNIAYTYEEPYNFNFPNSLTPYHPDFTIYYNDQVIYLEHFGISEDFKNDAYTKDELNKYIKSIHDKIALHKAHNTTLIYTFSKYNDKLPLLTHLEKLLKSLNIKLIPRSNTQIFNEIKEREDLDYFNRLAYLVSCFIQHFKIKAYTEVDFTTLKGMYKDVRSSIFLNLIEKAYLYYQQVLKEENACDFEDMINESTKILKEYSNKHLKLNFKYIIIDEYQDISRQRFNLVKELSSFCDARIIAVGDDFQAIYSFNGADPIFFLKFKELFGYCDTLKITKTYRNSQELIDIAGGFVLKNDAQINKSLKSDKSIKKPVVVFGFDKYQKDEFGNNINKHFLKAMVVKDVVEKAIQVDGPKQNILLIGRYGFDMKHLVETNIFKTKYIRNKEYFYIDTYPNVLLSFLTAHASKGLTYDNCILINCEDEVYGFPTRIEDDPVLKMVISDDKTYEYAEERRLFYVALTRTKNRVFLITSNETPSPFLKEIINDYQVTYHGNLNFNYTHKKNKPLCPVCGFPLVLKKHKTYGFNTYICTNEPELCGFVTNNLNCDKRGIHFCPKCNGLMIVKFKKKENSSFYGCTNYNNNKAKCTYTEDIKK